VLLAFMTAVLSAIIIVKELTPSTDNEIIYINFIVVILGLHILGLVTCICLPIRLRNPDTYTNITEHQHKLSKLRLACLCVFGLFAFFHASIHLSCDIMCSINTSELLCAHPTLPRESNGVT
jgi:cytochrome c biogenesis protein CcdA